MIPLIKAWWMALWFDPTSAAKLLRSAALFVGAMAVNVLAFPWVVVAAWTLPEWLYRVAAAGAIGFAGTIGVGQKNQTPEQIRAELSALPYDGVNRRAPAPPVAP